MRKVKIVCTLGPACADEHTIYSMVLAGMNVARFNFSHGDYAGHKENLDRLRKVEAQLDVPVATILDTKGPEIRTGLLKNHKPVTLKSGEYFDLVVEKSEGMDREVGITYKELPGEVLVGQDVFIDDGSLQLKIEEILPDRVRCVVVVGGLLGEQKGVNLPGAELSVPSLMEKDIEDIRWGIENEMDYVAVSFVRNCDDIMQVRSIIEKYKGKMKIVAKIETLQAVENLEGIVDIVDGVMVARGDLGVEMHAEDVPLVQKRIIALCRENGKAVIVATQMLDSMIRNPRPTRAEVNDVANAVLDGTDAVMLSGETASGLYPVNAVETMAKIVSRTEEEMGLWQRNTPPKASLLRVSDAVSHATKTIAEQLKARAIISITLSGSTARMISKYRPDCTIIAATPAKETWREMSLYWGVTSVLTQRGVSNVEEAIEDSVATCVEKNFAEEGDIVILTAGLPLGVTGTTNLLQVYTIGRIIAKGVSLIKRNASGFVCNARSAQEAIDRIRKGDILVAKSTSPQYLPAMKKAAAIVAEEPGLTSHAAATALKLGIPCIVGAENALQSVSNGILVTVDGTKGVVYQGRVKLG